MKKFCSSNVSLSCFAILPMNFIMAISTKRFQIFIGIVFSIFINMMHTQCINIFRKTSITNYFSMQVNRLCKSSYHVCSICSQCFVEKIRTFCRTKHFFFGLKIYTTKNKIFTNLTFRSLYTRPRTIFTILFVISCMVSFIASFANFFIFNLFIGFPRANSRTIYFFNSLSSIFTRKGIFTTQTFIHKLPQVKGVLCH